MDPSPKSYDSSAIDADEKRTDLIHDHSDADTLPDHDRDINKDPEKLSPVNSRGLSRLESGRSVGVDVERAQQDFAELNRELSSYSHVSRRSRVSRVVSHSHKSVHKDVEKGTGVADESSEEEPWELEATLRGAQTEEAEAGIKSKRIGM